MRELEAYYHDDKKVWGKCKKCGGNYQGELNRKLELCTSCRGFTNAPLTDKKKQYLETLREDLSKGLYGANTDDKILFRKLQK